MNYNPPIDAERLRKHYTRTLRDDKVLMTGHSHRAWPDRIVKGQMRAVEIAFREVDEKWEKTIFTYIIPEFQIGVAQRIGTDKPDHIAFGENTHELVTRVLSSFPWDKSTRVVTTNAEFHSSRREVTRLQENGVEVEYVPVQDRNTLCDRIRDAITPGTNAVIMSTVFFTDGSVLQNIDQCIERAREVNATVILDVYHQFNARRLKADELGRDIFLTAGGYKYASAGEGCAWLKVPEGCTMRPSNTGWFADFAALEGKYPNPIQYGDGGQRFLGATKDISGMCRQIEVFRFMDEQGLTVDRLEKTDLHQTAYMIYLFDNLGVHQHGAVLRSSRNDVERGPFLAIDLETEERAENVDRKLRQEYRVFADTRESVLRMGPAPYTTEYELEYAMQSLKKVVSGEK